MTITIKTNNLVDDLQAMRMVASLYENKVKFDLEDGKDSQVYTFRDKNDLSRVIGIAISKTKTGVLTFNFYDTNAKKED